MRLLDLCLVFVLSFVQATKGHLLPHLKAVLTNDDGWAVAQIRSEYDALKTAGLDASIPLCVLRALNNPVIYTDNIVRARGE